MKIKKSNNVRSFRPDFDIEDKIKEQEKRGAKFTEIVAIALRLYFNKKQPAQLSTFICPFYKKDKWNKSTQ